MSQAFHRFQMKMKTKMTIMDQELSHSAVGMYAKYMFWFLVAADSSTFGTGTILIQETLIYSSILNMT